MTSDKLFWIAGKIANGCMLVEVMTVVEYAISKLTRRPHLKVMPFVRNLFTCELEEFR